MFVERNSSGKEFHTLAPMKDVDFKPKFVDFLRGTTSLLVPLKFFTLLHRTNKSLMYSGSMPCYSHVTELLSSWLGDTLVRVFTCHFCCFVV